MGSSISNTARTVRLLVALLALGSFVLGAVLTGAYLVVRQIVEHTVLAYGKALGIALEPAEVRFGPTFVQLVDTKFVALEVPGVSGTLRRVDVDFVGMTPKRVLVSGVVVNASGNPLELANDALRYYRRIAERQGRPGTATALPELSWKHLSVNLSTDSPLLPTASLTELTIVTNSGPTHDECAITTASTKLANLDLGPLELSTRYHAGTFELGRGKTLQESAWRVLHRQLDSSDEVRFSFEPIELVSVLAQLGATTMIEDLRATKLKGHIEAVRDRDSGRSTGSFTLELTGFTPPYPPELKGYRFDDRTTARAKFELDPLLQSLELRGIELRTGELSLFGHGRVDRNPSAARVRAELTTTLDCVTLAKGWATHQLGGDLGQWSVRNAPKAVRGSVKVKVQLDAETDQLGQAKLVKTIGIGCGLRPMSLVELMNLGLPPMPDASTVERLMKQLPASPLTSNLPRLPQILPPFDLPTPFGDGKPPATTPSQKKPTQSTRPGRTTAKP